MLYKYKNLCETDDPIHFNEKIDEKYLNIEEIKKRINEGQDIIGRKDNFIKVNLDNSFPKFLINNQSFYSDWLIL